MKNVDMNIGPHSVTLLPIEVVNEGIQLQVFLKLSDQAYYLNIQRELEDSFLFSPSELQSLIHECIEGMSSCSFPTHPRLEE